MTTCIFNDVSHADRTKTMTFRMLLAGYEQITLPLDGGKIRIIHAGDKQHIPNLRERQMNYFGGSGNGQTQNAFNGVIQ